MDLGLSNMGRRYEASSSTPVKGRPDLIAALGSAAPVPPAVKVKPNPEAPQSSTSAPLKELDLIGAFGSAAPEPPAAKEEPEPCILFSCIYCQRKYMFHNANRRLQPTMASPPPHAPYNTRRPLGVNVNSMVHKPDVCTTPRTTTVVAKAGSLYWGHRVQSRPVIAGRQPDVERLVMAARFDDAGMVEISGYGKAVGGGGGGGGNLTSVRQEELPELDLSLKL